jgi:hypothetical protein
MERKENEMNSYRGVEVKLYLRIRQEVFWVSLRAGPDSVEKRKIFCSRQEQNLEFCYQARDLASILT